jgi:hypothetical protein
MFQRANKYSEIGQQHVIMNPMEGNNHVMLHLQQLYKNGSKANEESKIETATVDSGLARKSNMTSAEA